ncbi:MAG: hypothetical protein QMC77_08860, partial [Methanocellales archaeon]|nr:hypothetical protein [Methanocellales archaeon]
IIIKKARNIKKKFERVAAQGKSISKIDLDREYEEQIEERFVEEFCSAVKKKLKKKIDTEELYQAQVEERVL